MSATNRSSVRLTDDFYVTPPKAIQAILPFLPVKGHVLEPGAGNGAIVRELLMFPAVKSITAVESNEERYGLLEALAEGGAIGHQIPIYPIQEDVRAFAKVGHVRYDLIIGNPPYSLAMEFLEAGLSMLTEGGTMAMLLRLAFASSSKRAAFHKAHPSQIAVLSSRPSFTGNGKTDAAEYAWFVFGPERAGTWFVL